MPLYDTSEMEVNRKKVLKQERIITVTDMLGGLVVPVLVVIGIFFSIMAAHGILGLLIPTILGIGYLIFTYNKTRFSMIIVQIVGYLIWSTIVYFVIRLLSLLVPTV